MIKLQINSQIGKGVNKVAHNNKKAIKNAV